MRATRFTLPNQWEDWCSWGLGIWLCISPWALQFEMDAPATRTTVVSGVLLILAEVITLSTFRAWEEGLNILLAIWLIAAPWIVGAASVVATANFVVVGLLVFALAIYEITQVRSSRGNP